MCMFSFFIMSKICIMNCDTIDKQLEITNLYTNPITPDSCNNDLFPHQPIIDNQQSHTINDIPFRKDSNDVSFSELFNNYVNGVSTKKDTTNIKDNDIPCDVIQTDIKDNDIHCDVVQTDIKDNNIPCDVIQIDVKDNDIPCDAVQTDIKDNDDVKTNCVKPERKKYIKHHKNIDTISDMFETTFVNDRECVNSCKNIIIDNSLKPCFITMENSCDMTIKNMHNLNSNGNPSFITTNCGSFYLDDKCSNKTIVYNTSVDKCVCGWKIIGSKYNNFYPTKLLDTLQNNLSKSSFGSSVSVSGNGQQIIVGGLSNLNCIGGSWAFDYCSDNFVFNSELFAQNNIGCSFHGISVSSNYDGSVIAIGGSGDNDGIGACWLYDMTTGEQIKYKLIGSGNIGSSHQGMNVKLSSDGNMLFVGGSYDNNKSGTVWCFRNNGYDENYSDWGQLNIISVDDTHLFGSHIATNHDGSIIAISSNDNVRVFNLINDEWHCINTFTGTITDLYLSPCGKYLIAVTQYSIIILKNTLHKSSCEYKIQDIIHVTQLCQINKIFSMCSCANCKTIIISCVSDDDKYKILCFVKINGSYHLQSIIPIETTINHTNISLSMSHDGKITAVGIQSENDYDGSCIILS